MSQFTTLARPYAKAAFATAVAANRLNEWSAMLGLLAAVMADEHVAQFMSTPTVNADQQAQVLIGVCGDALDESGRNFVKVLAAKKRLLLLDDIAILFDELKAERERTVDVDVISAFAMDADATHKLETALKKRLQREVNLVTSIDSSLIGGLVIRAGDLVIDGSVRGKLNKLAETMNT